MIEYRPFLNSDAPLVAEVWRGQTQPRAVAETVTAAMLEEHVFSKLYFDRHGLIVAEEKDRLVGFVHAAFLANESKSGVSTSGGLINLLMTRPRSDSATIGLELLRHAERYLQQGGAKSIWAGSPDPAGPFYLGLYGGSQLPGVVSTDETWRQTLAASDYGEVERRFIFRRQLNDFRPPVDRHTMQIRRQCQVSVDEDPLAATWWDACTVGNAQRTRFRLTSKTDQQMSADAVFWNVEPLGNHWGIHVTGLLEFDVSEAAQQQGWAACLLAESLRRHRQEGVTTAEIQVSDADLPRIELVKRLGFVQVDYGTLFEKRAIIA